jgi:hypothetical protein
MSERNGGGREQSSNEGRSRIEKEWKKEIEEEKPP